MRKGLNIRDGGEVKRLMPSRYSKIAWRHLGRKNLDGSETQRKIRTRFKLHTTEAATLEGQPPT
jgi:hypothetical protein